MGVAFGMARDVFAGASQGLSLRSAKAALKERGHGVSARTRRRHPGSSLCCKKLVDRFFYFVLY